METLKIKLRKIGNSKGIVIPKKYLKIIDGEEEEEITLEINDDNILLKRSNEIPRKGWAEVCKKMAKNGGDALLIPDVFDDETFEEWN
ncbi:MAG: AbrB/MazE/SpoVT family DNA-binding domain-containing protein [Ginsengibacter sp.]